MTTYSHSKMRLALFRLVAVALGVALAMGVLEIGVRRLEAAAFFASQKLKKDSEPGLPVFTRVFELGAHSMHGVFHNAEFTSNSAGFRSLREFSEFPAAGVLRIAIIGDSFVMGDGVSDTDTYPVQLEAMLRQRGINAEVMNWGMSGSNAKQAVDRLELFGPKFHPHIVVYGWTLNDLEGPKYWWTTKGPSGAAISKGRRAMVNNHFRLLAYAWIATDGLLDLFVSRTGTYWDEVRLNYAENTAAWSEFSAQLDRFSKVTKALGACPVMFLHTHLTHLHPWHPFHGIYASVANAGRERGIPTIESFLAFEWKNPSKLWVSTLDPHPNREGDRILAETLAAGLGDVNCPTVDGLGVHAEAPH